MSANIDSLNIEIQANATKASKSIDRLTISLKTLQKSVAGLDTKSLKTLSSDLRVLGQGLSQLSKIKTPDYTKTIDNLQKFNNLNSSNLASVSAQLRNLGSAITVFSGVKLDSSSGNKLVKFMTKLSEVNVNSVDAKAMLNVATSVKGITDVLQGVTFDSSSGNKLVRFMNKLSEVNVQNVDTNSMTNVAQGIRSVAYALQGTKNVNANTIQLTNALARLASTSTAMASASGALIPFGANLKKVVNSLASASTVASSTTMFTTALGTLANAGNKTGLAAKNLGTLGVELRKFFAEMSKAPNVSKNTIEMTNALANLASQSRGTGNAIRTLSTATKSMHSHISRSPKLFSGLNMSLGSTRKSVMSLSSAIGGFYAKFFLLIRALKWINDSIGKSSHNTELQNVVVHTFAEDEDKLEEFTEKATDAFGMSKLSAKEISTRFQAMGKAMDIDNYNFEEKLGKSNAVVKEFGNGLYDTTKEVSDMSINLTKLAADFASFHDADQKQVAEAMESIYTGQTRPMRQFGIDLTEANLKAWALRNGIQANMETMSQAEKALLRYNYLLSQSGEKMGDFTRTANTWHNVMTSIKSKLEDLQVLVGNIGVNLLKPMMINFRDALNVVNSFVEKVLNSLGVIFGWKVTLESGMGSGSDSADEYAESIDDATGSVKKLNKQLQGFHELNVISTNDGGKGGGVASGFDAYKDALDEAKIIIEEADDPFKSSWDTLYKLGKGIGDSIAKGLSDIDWNSVYASASGFGTGLAEFLNGTTQPQTFHIVGQTIGKSLNSALVATNAFAVNYDFFKLGSSISTGISSALESIDWELAFETCKNVGTDFAKYINGLFNERLFESLGTTVANLINGSFTGLKSFSITADWSGVATSIKNGITKALNGIDWDLVFSTLRTFGSNLAKFLNGLLKPEVFSSLGTTLANSITGAFSFLNSFGTTFKWNQFGDSIGEGITNFFKNTDFTIASSSLSNVAIGIINALSSAITTTDWKTVGNSISTLISNIDFAQLTTSLSNLASSIITAIADAIKGVDWKALGKSIGEVLNNIDLGTITIDLAGLAGQILSAIGKALIGLGSENPLAGTLVTILLAIKVNGKLQALGDSIMTAIGSAMSKSTVEMSIPSTTGSGAFATFATKLGSVLGGAIAAGAAAVIGYSIGNWAYDNIPAIQKMADDIVALMAPTLDKYLGIGKSPEDEAIDRRYDAEMALITATQTYNLAQAIGVVASSMENYNKYAYLLIEGLDKDVKKKMGELGTMKSGPVEAKSRQEAYKEAYKATGGKISPISFGLSWSEAFVLANETLAEQGAAALSNPSIWKPGGEQIVYEATAGIREKYPELNGVVVKSRDDTSKKYSDSNTWTPTGKLSIASILTGIKNGDWKSIKDFIAKSRDNSSSIFSKSDSWLSGGKLSINEVFNGIKNGKWSSISDFLKKESGKDANVYQTSTTWQNAGKYVPGQLANGIINGNWNSVSNKLNAEASEDAKLYGGSIKWSQNSASIPNLMANGLNFSALRTKFANERDYESGQFVSDRWKTVANCIPSKLASGLGNFSSFNNSISTNRDYSSGQFVSDRWKNVSGLIPTKLANGLGNFASFNNSIAGKRDGASSLFANNTWESDSKTIPGLIENGLNATWGKTKKSMYSSFDTSGGYLVDGLKKGINDTWSSNKKGGLLSTISSLAGKLTETLNKAFGIHSPSKVWAESGHWLDMGLAKGITNDIPTLENTVSDMAYSMNDALDNALNPMSGKLSDSFALDDVNVVGSISKEFNASLSTTSNEQNALLRQQNELLLQILQKEGITSSDVFDAVRQQSRNYYNQTGRNALAF